MENCLEVSVDDERNLELVLPTMESHERIWFGHVDLHHFVVSAIFEVFVPGLFTVESLEVVQAEVLSSLTITIVACEYQLRFLIMA